MVAEMRINNESAVKSVCEDMKILGGKEISLKNPSRSDGCSLQSAVCSHVQISNACSRTSLS